MVYLLTDDEAADILSKLIVAYPKYATSGITRLDKCDLDSCEVLQVLESLRSSCAKFFKRDQTQLRLDLQFSNPAVGKLLVISSCVILI